MTRLPAPSESDDARHRASEPFSEQALRLLGWTASQLLMADDPLEFLHQIYDRMAESLELDVYFHFQVDVPGERLRLVAWNGVSEAVAEDLRVLAFGEAVCGTVAERREPWAVSWVQADEDPKVELIRQLGITAYVCHPLRVEDRLLGTLSFGSRRMDRFAPETLSLIRTASDHVAAALDRREKREALREQAAALARADRQKDEFLAVLGHELRNPLSALDTAARLLERGQGDERHLQAVIRSEVGQLTLLVNDLLDVSRITRGMIELRKEEIDLVMVARLAVEAVRSSMAEKRQELTFGEAGPVRLRADSTRLKQIVVNLLSNATRYSPREGGIRLEVGREDEQAVLRVVDDGCGMEQEMLEPIFEPFARVERSGDGLGIGLSLARQLAELHGGSLVAASEGLGHGSTFTLRLPIEESKGREESEVGLPSGVELESRGFRILVVDDHQDSADLLGMLLRNEGYVVEVAYTGRDAVSKARQFRPQAVLLDLALPDTDGFAVARRIRDHDSDIAILALTGFGDDETARRVEVAGFDHKLLKPVDPDDLRRLLDDLRPESPAPLRGLGVSAASDGAGAF